MDSRVIQIAHGGTFSGTAGIDVADIQGEFSGELTVRKCLTVRANGKVSGKIRYGKIVVEEGGEVGGEVKRLTEDEKIVRVRPAISGAA
jgi:cytoskeletal protein CcmA (bactofilin family)